MLTIIENKNETIDFIDDKGSKRTYTPDFNLTIPLELLKKFNNIVDTEGRKIYTCWDYQGFFIYPALQERLFWRFFVQVYKHREAWKKIRGQQLVFKPHSYWCGRGLFSAHHFLYHKLPLLHRIVYNISAKILRKKVKKIPKILFFDDGEHGFRYAKIKGCLSNYIDFYRVEKLNKENLSTLFKKDNVFVTGCKTWHYPKPPRFSYNDCPFLHPYLNEEEFEALIQSLHRQCCDCIVECQEMEAYLSKNRPQLIMGYDQIEDIIGIIVAAKRLGIPSFMFQHGLFTPYHAGWLCPDIPRQFCNIVPDKLSVWGSYWKDKLLSYSNRYHEGNVMIGAHHNRHITYQQKGKQSPQNKSQKPTVLFPYEFLTDNITVSKYIHKFLSLGWQVIVKMRPNGEENQDHLAYDPDIFEQVIFRINLSDEDLDSIDIIACTQTTFAYDMMQYHKPIWYLKTRFNFLQQIEDDGIAHFVDFDIIDKFHDPKILEQYLTPKYNFELFKALYSDRPLEDFLQDILTFLRY